MSHCVFHAMTNDSVETMAVSTGQSAQSGDETAQKARPMGQNPSETKGVRQEAMEEAKKRANVDPKETAKEAGRPKKPRKEKVLHTRVPAVLEQELKNLAESFRMPVSNLVRAILEDTIEAMDSLGRVAEGEIREVAERVARERERLRQPLDRARSGFVERATGVAHSEESAPSDESSWNHSILEGALGFTALVVANDSICPITGDRLPKGSEGYLALYPDPSRNIIVSPRAVPSR